ncbi:hypothetical protein KIN20_035852 [Parelaphostrongylus tenuis]|uniref:Uncharacterized protein n=1 Tax=Parelaphostrongylus tenuis TaxID=148309 RepID=A0AAD5RCE1_PARTN|nr:hypothetical protein KIN20_035852 [Parelaphostrongylus tenuis]
MWDGVQLRHQICAPLTGRFNSLLKFSQRLAVLRFENIFEKYLIFEFQICIYRHANRWDSHIIRQLTNGRKIQWSGFQKNENVPEDHSNDGRTCLWLASTICISR